MRSRRRGQGGQAMVELALCLSLMATIFVAGYDVARVFSTMESVSDMSRSGMRIGVNQDRPCSGGLNCGINIEGGTSDTDIGTAVRNTPATSLNAQWGLASAYATYGNAATDDNCTNTHVGTCGDLGGCASTSPFWTDTSLGAAEPATACFAVRTCYFAHGTCLSYDAWGTRPSCPPPAPSNNNTQCWQYQYLRNGVQTQQALDVRVVYKFTTVTPLAAALIGNNGVVYVTRDGIAPPLY